MFARSFRVISPRYLPKRFISTDQSNREAFLEHLEGGIAVLQLNRPASRNALSVRLVDEFRASLAEVRFSGYACTYILMPFSVCIKSFFFCRESRVLIIKSAVPGAFCSGADLKVSINQRSYATTTESFHLGTCKYDSCSSEPIPIQSSKGIQRLGGKTVIYA